MKKRSFKPQSQTIHEDVPFTMQLQDRRTLFVLVPGEWCGRDRSGELTFKPKAVAFLDRVQAMAMKMPVTPTPGFIPTLREAMGLTQLELGARVGVDKITVYRWERGMMQPGPAALKRLDKVCREAGHKGIVVAA